MPQWPATEQPLSVRAAHLHRSAYGTDATIAGMAPATWNVIGDHIDHIGGLVICGLAHLGAVVVASKRDDDTIMVTEHRRTLDLDEDTFTSSVALAEIAELAGRTTAEDEVPPRNVGGVANRLAGLTWMLVHRQFLSRDTCGFNITVVSDIPGFAGLGLDVATEVAWAMALSQLTGHRVDAPTRARLTEYCAAAAAMFAENSPVTARYAAAFRGHDNAYTIVDYADGSVTAAPLATDSHPVLVLPPRLESESDLVDDILLREHFARRAAKAFGVAALCRLPDAETRALQWLTAMVEMHDPADLPTVPVAQNWLTFFAGETERSHRAASALRARKSADVWAVLQESEQAQAQNYGLTNPAESALAELAVHRGAFAARAAAAGISPAVIAHVSPAKVSYFCADLSEDGFIVVSLRPGSCAEAIDLETSSAC